MYLVLCKVDNQNKDGSMLRFTDPDELYKRIKIREWISRIIISAVFCVICQLSNFFI
jgi:hypothetical protein